jgi:hypothetical protein
MRFVEFRLWHFSDGKPAMPVHRGKADLATARARRCRRDFIKACSRAFDDCSWHFSEVLRCPLYSRYRGKSGSDSDIATRLTQLGPPATSAFAPLSGAWRTSNAP